MTKDDVVTALAGMHGSEIGREALLNSLPTGMLRKVADLMFAVDYPDTATRKELVRGILAAQ